MIQDNHAVARASFEPDTAISGVSWAAILAGAFAAAALSSILLILGFGLGFSAISPWADNGLGAQALGYSSISWLTFTQIAASALGGYLAGRLRTKWEGIHHDEVYFRDTAHGFLTWAVASLATAAMLGSAIGSVLSDGAKMASSASAAVAVIGIAGSASAVADSHRNQMSVDNISGYFIDNLFRAPMSRTNENSASTVTSSSAPHEDENAMTPTQRIEVTRIFANAIQAGTLPEPDKIYIAQLVSKRSGLKQSDAEKRVEDIYSGYKKSLEAGVAKAKDVADKARKVAAYAALWIFVALLCGAFVASVSATFGGRQRDS